MADPISPVAGQVQALSKDIQDLAKQWDDVARKFSEADLSRVLKIDKVSADMQKFMHAVNGTTAAQQKMHRVEKELAKSYAKTRAEMIKLAKEKKDLEDTGKQRKLTAIERVRYADTKAALVFEGQKLKEINKLRSPQKVQELSEEYDGLQRSMQLANIKTFAFKKALDLLVKAFVGVYNWNERLQKNVATLAERFGAGTDAVLHMAQVAKREFLDPKGLGGMGFQVEEISQMLGDFREQMEFTGKITDEQVVGLLKWGKVAGLTSSEVGELARSMTLMGQSAADAEKFMVELTAQSRLAGVTSRALAKQFLGAGKALFELTGPRAQRALVDSAAHLAKLGTGLDKLKGFTDLTDNFDQTAAAAAKLNTVFGAQVNALQLFSEMDPAKRFDMVIKQLRAAGVTLDTVRTEKKFFADALQISEETANAVLTAAEKGSEYTDELKRQQKIEEERLKVQKSFDSLLERGKKVLIAWDQIAANFFDKFSSASVLGPLRTMFDSIMEFVRSDAMQSLVDGLSEAFTIVGDVVNVVWAAVKPLAKLVMGLLGAFLQGLGYAWKVIKFAIGAAGIDLGSSAVSGNDLMESGDKTIRSILAPFQETPASAAQSPGASAAPVPAMADGGTMRRGQVAIVGEEGPELYMAPSAGSVVNNQTTREVLAAAGGDQTVHVQVFLEGEILQDRMYKASLRRNS